MTQGHLIKETGTDWERNWRYNAAGRLSEIRDSADGLTVQYRYDPFGRRIAKTVTQGATSRTTYYINGESALMAEADEEGRITRAYGFNPHTQQSRTNEEDEDEQEGSLWSTDPIWQADLNGKTSLKEASYHYLVTDHLGTPVLALNKAGETTWKANYEAFGKTRINPASTAQINLRLPGQYFDAETGLHQNWNRDYAPGIGRYVQADPIGLAGGLNVYQYAYGNPLVYYDSLGLICFNFDILANHVREYRAPLSVVLGTLVAELFYGVVPKTSFERRKAVDSKNPKIHDYTNQPSRRVAKALKEGRITTEEAKAIRHKWRNRWMITHGIVVLLVAEGFYDLGVVMGGAWEATSFERCECN